MKTSINVFNPPWGLDSLPETGYHDSAGIRSDTAYCTVQHGRRQTCSFKIVCLSPRKPSVALGRGLQERAIGGQR